jgi:kynurenine 3-monooxygenase
MSSKTADPDFLLRKKIENWFSNKHPDIWVPLYSRVTFSDKPYAEALAIGDYQRKVMDQVMEIPGIEKKWDSTEVENKILKLLDNKPVFLV